jgi:diguanylate cyclase (GGDEF)-like protein/putative nucleotidyltransferase with HDIG domain
MDSLAPTIVPPQPVPPQPVPAVGAPAPLAVPTATVSADDAPENQLLRARLGIATSLFTALRYRHAPTAAHSLRVTLECASWALAMGLSEEQRDLIEVAALLHDIGKIAVPDAILLKPDQLTPDEAALMEIHRLRGVDILRCGGASQAVLDIVYFGSAWHDGSRQGFERAGHDLPFGARMLAIADAFDSMTWDKPYRRAVSRERAFTELFRQSGTQFDPDLVKVFTALHECDQTRLHEQVAQRWLESLDQPRDNAVWQLNAAAPSAPERGLQSLFQQTMLDTMRDGVIFLDASLRVTLWNSGAERMTGLAGESVQATRFLPSLLDMRDDDGITILDDQCPAAHALQTGEQQFRRLTIRGRGRKDVSVEAQIVPVLAGDGTTQGVSLVLHDVSPEMSLEARCHSLQEMATKDPLTRVANRAEFNRVHAMFVHAHLDRQLPCSLILADIDHFKQVNDTFGHPAGDEVLKSFAKLLKSCCRPGDLVARYGGEEFVIVCADCDNAAAARRADEIRKRLGQIQQPALENRRVTASFGVTEVQPGDTPETMLARADRGLYDAKARGRNQVVQVGSGLSQSAPARSEAAPAAPQHGHLLAEQDLVSAVPMSVAIEKLRGFVADQSAEVLSVDQGRMKLRVGQGGFFLLRRTADRNIPLLVDLSFQEAVLPAPEGAKRNPVVTRMHVEIRPLRGRDRRRAEAAERARQLLASFRAYLMAVDDSPSPDQASAAGESRGRRASDAR